MDSALIFTVPQPIDVARIRCQQAIAHLGAPLKSDSGHFITGVVSSGHNNIELRVTWLAENGGTQITVTASHDDIDEQELQNAAQRFRFDYLNHTSGKIASKPRVSFTSIMVVAGALAAIAMFCFAMMNHK